MRPLSSWLSGLKLSEANPLLSLLPGSTQERSYPFQYHRLSVLNPPSDSDGNPAGVPAPVNDDTCNGTKHNPNIALLSLMDSKVDSDTSNTGYPVGLVSKGGGQETYLEDAFPTEEEIRTLPRVADKIPWRVYTIAFVESCERFSYYGTQILFQNFVQRNLLTPTGAAPDPNGATNNNPGALGRGQQTATALSTFFSFWCYLTPLLGAWIADTYLGRYKTIMCSIACAVVGHLILTAGAIPSVLAHSDGALITFIVALIVFGLGTGGFKPNISPLIAEQVGSDKLRVSTNSKGQRIIIDPAQTSARVYNWFYLFINIGALVGQLSMAYTALWVGYWLAFLLPTCMFLMCPVVLILCKKNYQLTPPQGSVLGPALKIFFRACKGKWSLNPLRCYENFHDGKFWEDVKPSNIAAAKRPTWMNFDDAWVEEVRRGFKACSVFLWYPLYWVTYNQINNNLTSQADMMQHQGVPPEIVSQLDPLTLIILIPICDLIIYPALRKAGIRFTPIKKITLGFITGAFAMVWAAVVQNYIYNHNECGRFPSEGRADGSECGPATVSIFAQSGSYVLIAISEILASITSLEYAYTKAPKNMRSLVQAVALFMTAIASAIGEALNFLSTDPLLVWNYGTFAVVAFAAGMGFWFTFASLDSEEDMLNSLPAGRVSAKSQKRIRRHSSVDSGYEAHNDVDI